MIKLTFVNNTKSKLWIQGFCFVPGTSIAEVTKEQKKEIELIFKNNEVFKKAKADKKMELSFEEEKTKEENVTDNKESVEK